LFDVAGRYLFTCANAAFHFHQVAVRLPHLDQPLFSASVLDNEYATHSRLGPNCSTWNQRCWLRTRLENADGRELTWL
jgi:hypothetical protein